MFPFIIAKNIVKHFISKFTFIKFIIVFYNTISYNKIYT